MRVLNIGSINIDHVYEVDHFVRAGETLSGLSYKTFAGGKGFNQSIALTRAGVSTLHAGRVGKDATWLLNRLQEEGVDTRHVTVGDDATDQAAAPHRVAVWLGLPAVAVAAVGVAVWIAGVDQERTWSGYHLPRWCAPVFALATAGAVVAIATLTRTRRAGHLRLAALGVVVVALGSGIGRARVEVYLGAGGGDLVGYLVSQVPDSGGPGSEVGTPVGVVGEVFRYAGQPRQGAGPGAA